MTDALTKPGWRYQLGFWMFTIPFALMILAPVVVPLFVSSAKDAAAIIGGVILVGEIVWFASIPLLGKQGFKELEHKAFALFKLPKGPIGESHHRWGLRLLLLGMLIETLVVLGLLVGYFVLGDGHLTEGWFGLSFEQEATLFVGAIIASALGMIIGIYMLGAPFVERLTAAMTWDGESSSTMKGNS